VPCASVGLLLPYFAPRACAASDRMRHVEDEETARRVVEAIDKYNPYYDEVFWEVNARIRNHHEAGKLDLAALICWKRSGQGHWVSDLMELSDAKVREHCRRAFAPRLTDQQRLDALAPLPGFKGKYAIATAVLACNDPDEFGIVDWRALKGLERIDRQIARGAAKLCATWSGCVSSATLYAVCVPR
jgi:hypothetical protein